ncbi:DUF3519 domain-containing protein, partial [Helicobacter pylori]|uniref:DUF3519 domain-containing protein n=1 Tax=Helicobacter pylori TaxID=210 RepID=UPI0039DFF7FA
MPKGMSVEEFKKSLESVENKDRFLEHLKTRDNSDERLAALNLVEPILREPHIEIFTKDNAIDKKEYIKAFKDENNTCLYMLITQDNDKILRTFIPKLNERYMRSHVRNADIIHSFIQPNRTAKSDNALSDVVVYGENTTQKPLTSQEDLLKTSENLNEATKEAKNLSPLEQANAEKLAKLESEKEFTRLKEQEQARKKRALERSHSISDFNKQLELSAKNSKFTNNTLKIIEELNNGVKQASGEIKEKVTKYEKALTELQKIDESTLSKEQQQGLKVFKGELDQTAIKGIDLNDLYILEQGSRNAGARKILRKHYGEENTGGLTNDELINMSEVIKNGSVLLESFERIKNGFRYAYEWDNNGVKLRLVVDDLNNGDKIFDFYSDRNFKDFRGASLHSGNHPYENNPTPKPLTSQEELLKTSKNLNHTQEAKNLSPL